VSDFFTTAALEAVVLQRAAPGFVGNRLQFALLREALHIVHSGIASPEVVDRVMRASSAAAARWSARWRQPI
jgi:3-hydroxybutyryl-CoA dehydrogenase